MKTELQKHSAIYLVQVVTGCGLSSKDDIRPYKMGELLPSVYPKLFASVM
jgi:hypothetical protein